MDHMIEKGFTKEAMLELFAPPSAGALDTDIQPDMLARLEEFLVSKKVMKDNNVPSLVDRFKDSKSPDYRMSFTQYMQYLLEVLLPYSINMSSPRCMGHMTGGLPTFAHPIGWFITALNQNLVKRESSYGFSLLERQTLGMLHRLIYGYSDCFYNEHVQNDTSILGIMTSGGSLANLTALWIARNACLGPSDGFAGVEVEGFPAALKYYGFTNAVVLGSGLNHYSIGKAGGVLGIGERNIINIPVDECNRVDTFALRQKVVECFAQKICVIAIVGVAGTTEFGSIDSLAEMADLAQAFKIHFHVDAAWGAPLLFSQQHRSKLKGIERADTITVDGHKQLYLPIGNSMLILREPTMAKVIKKHSQYILRENADDLGKCSLEGSRPGNILFLHAALHIIGNKGYEYLVDENILKAQIMANLIRDRTEFQLLGEPQTNILLYRYIPQPWRMSVNLAVLAKEDNEQINVYNQRIQDIQYEGGQTFVSRTTVTLPNCDIPIVALRAVLGNPFTEIADIEKVLDDQLGIATILESKAGINSYS